MKNSLLSLVALLLLPVVAQAENWPNWRGPGLNGVAPGEGYATEWSTTKNVDWHIALPGRGASTPIVWGDRIFLTCGIDGQNAVLCYDRSGKQLWERRLGDERAGKHKKASGSNPSAVTDGKQVFVYFKSGDLAALSFDGQVAWQTNLQDRFGEDTLWWDLGTSPVLTKNAVVVAVMQTGPSYLVAFDKSNGELLWKEDRNLDAPEEAAQSYSTPVVLTGETDQKLIVLGADHVTAHDAATGKEIWRVGGLNPTGHKFFRSIASPVVADGIVIAPYARGASLTAIKLGGKGDITKSHIIWERENISADVPTPAAVNGRVYVCTDKGTVACLNIESGETIWTGELEKNRNAYSSSPILADGKIYITREDGVTFVLAQGDEFKVLARNELEGMIVATPVFVDGKILIRTFENLFCIGN